MVGRQHLRVGQALACLDQRVPGPGAVVAGIDPVQAGVGVGRGLGCGQRGQRGLDDRGVLEGAAALEPDSAQAVLDQGEEPVEVGGAFELVELLLLPGRDPVGVEDLQQPLAELVQLGGVQPGRVLEEERLPGRPQRGVEGQQVQAGHDHLGVLGGDLPGRQRRPGRLPGAGERGGGAQDPPPRRGPPAGGRGQVVGRGGPARALVHLAGLDLHRDAGLHRGQGGAQPLDLQVDLQQLARRLGRPHDLAQLRDRVPGRGHHPADPPGAPDPPAPPGASHPPGPPGERGGGVLVMSTLNQPPPTQSSPESNNVRICGRGPSCHVAAAPDRAARQGRRVSRRCRSPARSSGRGGPRRPSGSAAAGRRTAAP